VVFQNTQALLLNCRDLRRTGSCACDMASVALGRFDAVAELSIKEWDVCAGCLIVQESGGVVSNFNGLSTVFFNYLMFQIIILFFFY
jgi:myo-inositol-1(or 4)-monophosphatase